MTISHAVSDGLPAPSVPVDAEDLDLDQGLARFGHAAFRPGQRDAIAALLAERRLLLVAPTGGGKSLTYQLPAVLLRGTTIVVSPLIALMADQVAALTKLDIPATYLAATLASDELRRRMAAIADGAFKIVYVAPERLAFGGFRAVLGALNVPLVAIDEAHCISEWGHDFRPEYLHIGAMLQRLAPARIMACTATATPVVRDEILARLGLAPDTAQIVRGFARPNLALRVLEVRQAKERRAGLDAVLREALGSPGQASGTAIVYGPTRKRCEQEAERLATTGWRTAAYHAGMAGGARERVQRGFMDDALDVVVATNAFGMGIDRADVRAVVHLAPPGSIEAYYQEVGRAGRDGEPACALMMVADADLPLRRRLIDGNSDDARTDPAIVEHKWNMFLELMRWSEGGTCRHDAILRYFGDEAETLHGCGRCDVCLRVEEVGEADEAEVRTAVLKALSAVARIHGKFGLTAAAKLLRGREDPRLVRLGLEQTRTFGALRAHPEAWIVQLLRRCVTAGWVDFHGLDHPVVYLTDEGKQAMKGERPIRLVLPSNPATATPTAGTSPRPRVELELGDDEAREVFEALRRHRLDRARADGVPPYVVASDRTLRDIALLRPRTLQELAMAKGIGPAKLERYGEGLLAVVAARAP